ncbi:ATP-binding protein [Faecalispora sporosphaeroides]|uniref:ATP-binding protein n=1 Tax=Faecalispora sporosphaeroides TaxID=1549 RepID=UPI00036EBF84|nr:ATP-binding protein [Faecalispora sporosphaeroides]
MDISTVGTKIDDIPVEISYKIIQLFSAGLYSSPNKAFEELVCNSYDAFADKVCVYLPNDLSAEGTFIWVCDNGEGLDTNELKDLWHIGESSKRLNTDRDKKRLQIGQFGIGKLATYVLARKLTYISKKTGRYILATMDYDKIHGSVNKLNLDEREIDETTATQLLSFYTNSYNGGKLEFDLFGEKAVSSWTFSILTDLRPKVQEISEGRLKWILRTALPLNPQFNLFYNGQRVESSKIDVPILKEWIVGKDDKTAETFKGTVCSEHNGEYTIDFENLKGVSGKFILYKDSLVSGKSSGLGRSHGIFLNIRGRLINLDDPLLGMEAFSHGAFNRTRIIIDADELDNNLTSTREAVKESLPYKQLKDYIKRKFNSEVRTYYFDEENREADKRTISYRLSQTSYTTSKRPIYNFAKRYFAGEIVNPFLIERPSDSKRQTILDAYEKDIDTGSQVIETVEWASLSTGAPIAKLNLEKRLLTINSSHPYIANYADAYQNTLPLQSIAITEVLTEAHLYELGIEETQINEVMRKRDTTLRELALSDREGIPAVALFLKEAIANPTALEDAVYRVLLALGFETIKIGGNGKPDGKADARLGYNASGQLLSYSLTYDAKSTAKD